MVQYSGSYFPSIQRFFDYCFSQYIIDDHCELIFFNPFDSIQKIQSIASSSTNVKIFFSGENTESKGYDQYSNEEHLSNYVDVIAGFFQKSNKSTRFPLWLFYYDYYTKGLFNSNNNQNRDNSALLVAQNLANRKEICETISNAGLKVFSTLLNCGNGVIYYQMPDRNAHIIDTKVNVISNFKYNICSENSNSISGGYTTEKLFHSLQAGCIPLYWPCNQVESNIINNKYICFIEPGEDSNSVQKKIDNVNDIFSSSSNFWMEDAYYYIALMYLNFFYKVCNCMKQKNLIKDIIRQQNAITYPINSINNKDEINEILKKHYKVHNTLFEPQIIFSDGNTDYFLDSFFN
jgi:hypothetical protein